MSGTGAGNCDGLGGTEGGAAGEDGAAGGQRPGTRCSPDISEMSGVEAESHRGSGGTGEGCAAIGTYAAGEGDAVTGGGAGEGRPRAGGRQGDACRGGGTVMEGSAAGEGGVAREGGVVGEEDAVGEWGGTRQLALVFPLRVPGGCGNGPVIGGSLPQPPGRARAAAVLGDPGESGAAV